MPVLSEPRQPISLSVVRAVANARNVANSSVSSAVNVTHGQLAESARDEHGRVAVCSVASARLVVTNRSAERQAAIGFARRVKLTRTREVNVECRRTVIDDTHTSRARNATSAAAKPAEAASRVVARKSFSSFSLVVSKVTPNSGESELGMDAYFASDGPRLQRNLRHGAESRRRWCSYATVMP